MFLFKLIPSKILSSQARKPTGFIGRYLMTKIFNEGNADLNSFVKECLHLLSDDKVFEIGFGTGKLIKEIAAITTEGQVEGIDFSPTMFERARKANLHNISTGKVHLHQGDCRALPAEENSFDKLCSINTIYFFEDPENYFKEIHRILKPNGIIAIGFRDNEQMSKLNLDMEIFRTYSKDDVANLLINAGFLETRILEKDSSPFVSYCAIGKKPNTYQAPGRQE
jgi:ubiquinone/menaquinone biosynthesis C-methylase UbiE